MNESHKNDSKMMFRYLFLGDDDEKSRLYQHL